MADLSGYCVILTTVSSEDDADRISNDLITDKLAGCVQIQEIISRYSWNGVVHKEKEWLLLIKTRRSLYQDIKAYILQSHPYEVPELLMIPVEAGLESYLNWIHAQTEP